jgi:hypothetical protein
VREGVSERERGEREEEEERGREEKAVLVVLLVKLLHILLIEDEREGFFLPTKKFFALFSLQITTIPLSFLFSSSLSYFMTLCRYSFPDFFSFLSFLSHSLQRNFSQSI